MLPNDRWAWVKASTFFCPKCRKRMYFCDAHDTVLGDYWGVACDNCSYYCIGDNDTIKSKIDEENSRDDGYFNTGFRD